VVLGSFKKGRNKKEKRKIAEGKIYKRSFFGFI